MTVYVDKMTNYPGKGEWCHMATDGPIAELHTFAFIIGLRREWFQDHKRVPHYDLREHKRYEAIRAGAVEVSSKELFSKCSVVGK